LSSGIHLPVGSCCDLHQNRFPGPNLCYIDNIVFVFVAVIEIVLVAAIAVVVIAGDHSSIQDNHVARQYLRIAVSFCLFSP
jgi:hypothetical protein